MARQHFGRNVKESWISGLIGLDWVHCNKVECSRYQWTIALHHAGAGTAYQQRGITTAARFRSHHIFCLFCSFITGAVFSSPEAPACRLSTLYYPPINTPPTQRADSPQ